MHLLELAEKQGQHHDARHYGELGGLKVNRPEVKPTARAINFLPHEFGEDQKEQASQIHRPRVSTNPAIIDQAGAHEGAETDRYPVGLLAPKIRRHRILAHVGGAVDGDHPEDGQGEHDNEQKPIKAEQFSQKRRHVVRDSRAGKYMEASNVDYTQLAEFATASIQARIDKFPRK